MPLKLKMSGWLYLFVLKVTLVNKIIFLVLYSTLLPLPHLRFGVSADAGIGPSAGFIDPVFAKTSPLVFND